MTAFPVNKPAVIATAATDAGTVLVTSLPSAEAWSGQQGAYSYSGQSPPPNLTICDAASFADANIGNVILDVPFTRLAAGQTLAVPATSNGLTISAVPPGCAVSIDIP